MKNRIEIISQEQRRAKVTMLLPIVGGQGVGGVAAKEFGRPADGEHLDGAQGLGTADGLGFDSVQVLKPVAGDYIYPVFRALSASVIPGYWLDYSRPGVLEQSASMLQGQTVYKNHDFMDVEQWVGVVNRSFWDPAGEHSGNVPGINVEMKIDWRMNPRIARGLLMQPPAIHSASVTVLFEYDYSHAQLAEEGKFWEAIGEEVNGELVRLLVTKILGYWEISLVFQGADQLAKQLPDSQGKKEEMSIGRREANSLQVAGEQTRLALTQPVIEALGLVVGERNDLTEEVVTARLKQLTAAAETGEYLLQTVRNEAFRVARLAEAKEEFELGVSIEQLIDRATPNELEEITKFYAARVARGFPHTCQSCGATSHTVRSSIETGMEGVAQGAELAIANALH